MHRRATCRCGQLAIECRGEPVRVSICHCRDCQRRTGGPFGLQLRFAEGAVTASGTASEFIRVADSGRCAHHRFCQTCGSTLWWTMERDPGLVVVAGGAFADPSLPAPWVEVYTGRRYPWTAMPALTGIESHP